MKRTLLFILELLICTMPLLAAEQIGDGGDVTVSGTVTSEEDGQPLIGVVVMSSAGGASARPMTEAIRLRFLQGQSSHFMPSATKQSNTSYRQALRP